MLGTPLHGTMGTYIYLIGAPLDQMHVLGVDIHWSLCWSLIQQACAFGFFAFCRGSVWTGVEPTAIESRCLSHIRSSGVCSCACCPWPCWCSEPSPTCAPWSRTGTTVGALRVSRQLRHNGLFIAHSSQPILSHLHACGSQVVTHI